MKTPFPFEYIADSSSFYGRKKEVETLVSHIENSTNVLLFSKRRMGKSTLIKNVFSKVEKKYTVIYIDIFNIITATDFAKLLLKGITDAHQEGDITKSIKFLSKLFKRTRVEPTFDPISGKMGIRPVLADLSFEELLEDAFSALFEISKKKNIALAIDEFQQIALIKDTKIDAILRKYMQEANNISYIFSGSKRNILNSLFAYKAPLFEMATPLSLKSISSDEIFTYAKKYLDISKETIDYIYEISDEETKLIQMILHKMYLEDKKVDEKDVDIVIEEILVTKNDHYKALFEIFSTNQKKAFKLLSKYKKEMFSHQVLRVENISRASMQSSLKQLYSKEFIDKEDDIWFIPDRTFELWGERVLNN